MVVRAQWSNSQVAGLAWLCLRAPGCEGTRRIRNPDEIKALAYDASTQAIFEWQSARDGQPGARQPVLKPDSASGLRGLLGKMLGRGAADEYIVADTGSEAAVGYFDPLVEHGFVILDDRILAARRARVDNLVIGPSGVFVVERKAWAGQVMTTTDAVFVDGRERVGATDEVTRITVEVERALDYELKPLGIAPRAAILFQAASNRSFEATLGKVLMGGTRGLPKLIRGRSDPVLGPETIVRLALAADHLLG